MTKLRNIKAVLFDMDETIILHSKTFEDVARDVYGEFSDHMPGVSFEQFWKTFWSKAVDMWFMMFDGVLSGEHARRYTYVNTLRALGADEALADEMVDRGDFHLVMCTMMEEDAAKVLHAIKEAGLKTALVTNGYSVTQRKKIAHHKLDEIFDEVFVSEEVGSHKPHPAIFRQALQKLGVKADEALFVGDMPENDIEGAMAVGMPAVHVDVTGKWADIRDGQRRAESTYAITRLADLLPILGLNMV